MYAEQIVEVEGNQVAQKRKKVEEGGEHALPGGWGGLAGDAVHQISLGCVSECRFL